MQTVTAEQLAALFGVSAEVVRSLARRGIAIKRPGRLIRRPFGNSQRTASSCRAAFRPVFAQNALILTSCGCNEPIFSKRLASPNHKRDSHMSVMLTRRAFSAGIITSASAVSFPAWQAQADGFPVTDQRIALVIGNWKYKSVGCDAATGKCVLNSPAMDAKGIAAALGRLGYIVRLLFPIMKRSRRRSQIFLDAHRSRTQL
jgi:hypothetical protein